MVYRNLATLVNVMNFILYLNYHTPLPRDQVTCAAALTLSFYHLTHTVLLLTCLNSSLSFPLCLTHMDS